MSAKLSNDPEARKAVPLARGLLDYFPLACAAVAELSLKATQQHHPDKEMHWDRSKSGDHADSLVRHVLERGSFDSDNIRHSTKAAWRALAMLQTELEVATYKPQAAFDVGTAYSKHLEEFLRKPLRDPIPVRQMGVLWADPEQS